MDGHRKGDIRLKLTRMIGDADVAGVSDRWTGGE